MCNDVIILYIYSINKKLNIFFKVIKTINKEKNI